MVVIQNVGLNPTNDMVVKDYLESGVFEPMALSFWEQALVPGEVAIDVGAYTGLYALIASKRGCKSIAYECNPIVLKRLKENTHKNSLEVDIRQQAVSNHTGQATFWIKPGTILTSASSLNKTEGYSPIQVDVVTLQSEARVCAIKIDVEGAEFEVLHGAEEILKKWKPRLIVECLTQESEDKVTNLLEEHGYVKIILDHRNFAFL